VGTWSELGRLLRSSGLAVVLIFSVGLPAVPPLSVATPPAADEPGVILGAAPARRDPPLISADAAVLIEWRTGQVLYAREAFGRRRPASTTKILTAVVALENARLTDVTRVSANAAYTPGSYMPLYEGQEITIGELVWGALLESGNNACVAIAEHIAGSERAFVELMNRRARALGALDTHFRNAHGIDDPDHYTTAYDLAVIARHALAIPAFSAMVRTREATLRGGEWEVHLVNTNGLLWTFAGADGVKTGTTDLAGRCLVASATRGGRRLLSVVLHSDDRYRDSALLLDWGFGSFEAVRLAEAGEVLAHARVSGGAALTVPLVVPEDFWVSRPRWDGGTLELEVHFRQPVSAPVRRGQVAGVVEAALGDRILRAVNLVAAEDVPARTLERLILASVLRLIRFLAAHGVG
jgi:D-alanyl-D-alanine carboxypeptidase (penicillin-binding protein 5/6)